MMIKYIVSDLDGTLLDQAGQLSEKNSSALTKTELPVTLVSARAPQTMMPSIQQLALTGPQIAFNGGVIFKASGDFPLILAEHPLKRRTAQQLVTALQTEFPEISLSGYDLQNWYVQGIDDQVTAEATLTHQSPRLMNLSQLLTNPVLKLFKLVVASDDPERLAQINTFINDLALTDIAVQQSQTQSLEITADCATKEQALATILDAEQLTAEQVAAFGDGPNDQAMLQSVAHPIAMQNAVESVQAISQFVTKSNVHDGVSYGIKKYITKFNRKVG